MRPQWGCETYDIDTATTAFDHTLVNIYWTAFVYCGKTVFYETRGAVTDFFVALQIQDRLWEFKKLCSARLNVALAASGVADFEIHVKSARRYSGDVVALSTRGLICFLWRSASERRHTTTRTWRRL